MLRIAASNPSDCVWAGVGAPTAVGPNTA